MDYLLIIGVMIAFLLLSIGSFIAFWQILFTYKVGWNTNKIYSIIPVYADKDITRNEVIHIVDSILYFIQYKTILSQDYDISAIENALSKCVISINKHLYSNNGTEISGKAIRFKKYWRWSDVYVIHINFSNVVKLNMTNKTIAYLIIHEFIHHYVSEYGGNNPDKTKQILLEKLKSF